MSKEFLVWIEVGGEQGDRKCQQVDYKICRGEGEEEVLKDWLKQKEENITFDKLKCRNGLWSYYSRPIRIFELNQNFDNGHGSWKQLQWV